jgi:hypothetical protein
MAYQETRFIAGGHDRYQPIEDHRHALHPDFTQTSHKPLAPSN